MRRGLARRDIRRFPRRLALVAAHVAHFAGKRLVQPAQALVLREQLRCIRGFVEEGVADIRVARIECAHVVRGAFDLFGREGHIKVAVLRVAIDDDAVSAPFPSVLQNSFLARVVVSRWILTGQHIRIFHTQIRVHYALIAARYVRGVAGRPICYIAIIRKEKLFFIGAIHAADHISVERPEFRACTMVYHLRRAVLVHYLASDFRRKIFVKPLDKSEEICYSKRAIDERRYGYYWRSNFVLRTHCVLRWHFHFQRSQMIHTFLCIVSFVIFIHIHFYNVNCIINKYRNIHLMHESRVCPLLPAT